MSVDIIDYGMGNLGSISSALDHIGVASKIVSSPESLKTATHIILPGVGSFSKAMQNLSEGGWCDAIRNAVEHNNASLLGICLGMHLLSSTGTEHGETTGLGLIEGNVVHFKTNAQVVEEGVLVPHVGWNEVAIQKKDDPIFQDIKEATDFYFVHSYYFDAVNEDHVLARTPHGFPFPSVIRNGKVWGAQFHPEKSGPAGFSLLKNFVGV